MKNFIRRSVSVILTAVLIFGVFIFHTSAVDGETTGIIDGRIYYLINSNSGKALDVSAGNTADNSDVSQYTYTFGTYWQEWRIRYVGNGDYTIEDMHSRKLITNINDDARISSANGSDSQKFRIVRNSNGTYTFMSKSSGYTKSLGIYQSGTANGNTLRVLDNDSSANQKFTLRAEKTYGITDGFIYSLINVGDGQAVDIPGGATAPGTYACKYTFSSMNPWQRFKVQLLDDGDCNLVDMNSGKLLSIVGSSANNGANAWIYDNDGTDGQKFRIQRTSDGTYTIYSKCSNYKMALGWNGVNLVQLAEDGSNNQKFRLVLAGCVYSIENVATGNCIDVSNGYTANGSDVSQYPYTGSRWQHWLIEYMQGETYRIMDMNSGKYLAIEGSSSANDANAWIWTWDNTNGEKFRIWYNGDDTVTFFTEAGTAGNMVLTLQGGAGSTATLVQQHHNGSDNQKFVLTPRATSAVPEEGIYFFKNADLGHYMQIDDEESVTTEGAKFELWGFDGDNDQKWEIDYTADGYYRILSVASGKAVTAPPSGNDKNITQTVYAGGDNQWWIITVTDNGMYNLSPKSNPSYRMAASFGAFTPDGRNVELRDPQTDNKDEWVLDPYSVVFYGITNSGHDHISCLNTVAENLSANNWNDVLVRNGAVSSSTCKNDLLSANIFTSRSHGQIVLYSGTNTVASTGILLNDESGTAAVLFYSHAWSNMSSGSDNLKSSEDYSNVDIALFIACETGYGGEGARNLPTAIVEYGATAAIGFQGNILCNSANEWTKDFYNQMQSGATLEEAVDFACDKAPDNSGLKNVTICGDRTVTFP